MRASVYKPDYREGSLYSRANGCVELSLEEQKSSSDSSAKSEVLVPGKDSRDQDFQQIMEAVYSKAAKHVVLKDTDNAKSLESKGFGVTENGVYYLKDYEVLYLMYNDKLSLTKGKKKRMTFIDYVHFAQTRDENAWTRFLIFRDLRSRGYVVREGFGFPIDFRVYERGDYGNKAAKYIVFGLNEGKTMTVAELSKYVKEMSTMGKEAVIAVVERRGEVIYYKVGKWRPIKPL